MKEVHKENETLTEELSELDGSEEFSTANLPSRNEIDSKKNQKTKVKIKFPFVKMLALFFVIILGTVWVVATQMTKDSDSAKSFSEKESEYEESIGEISGFDDEEEEKENEEAAVKEEATEETKEADTDTEQQESAEEEKVTEETKVTTTETAGTADSKEQTTNSKEETESVPTVNNSVTEHVVQSNENLFRIALKYYSSAEGVEIIKRYNGLSSNEITVGQVLKIPPR